MNTNKTIELEQFKQVVQQCGDETVKEFPDLYFDYAGIIPTDDTFRYESTPINTEIFAATGGDGVHYSILQMSETIQPVIMTVPANSSDNIDTFNWILGENLDEFLSLGYYNGWFNLEEICYNPDAGINFYKFENKDQDYQVSGEIEFVKKIRMKLGFKHIPLSYKRMITLKKLYFDKLKFNPDFINSIKNK